jgi:hypothetical protein
VSLRWYAPVLFKPNLFLTIASDVVYLFLRENAKPNAVRLVRLHNVLERSMRLHRRTLPIMGAALGGQFGAENSDAEVVNFGIHRLEGLQRKWCGRG